MINKYTEFERHLREGWTPHSGPKSFKCGWCGQVGNTYIGLSKHKESEVYGAYGPFHTRLSKHTDVRICQSCWMATTFLDRNRQFPKPLLGESFDARQKPEHAQMVVELYDEAREALSQSAPSCAILMFRKILMHIAVEQGAKQGLKFVQFVEYFKNEGVVGKPQHGLLDRIKDEGNDENHQIRRATDEQAADLLKLVTLLIRSVYFAA